MKRMTEGCLIEMNKTREEEKPWSENKKDVVGAIVALAIVAAAIGFAYYRLVVLKT